MDFSIYSPYGLAIISGCLIGILTILGSHIYSEDSTAKLPNDIGGRMFDAETKIKALERKENEQLSFVPKIDLNANVASWSDEELDGAVRTTDQIAEDEARSILIHNRDWKALQNFRTVLYSEKQKRMNERTPIAAPKQKQSDTPAQSETPTQENPFPFLRR